MCTETLGAGGVFSLPVLQLMILAPYLRSIEDAVNGISTMTSPFLCHDQDLASGWYLSTQTLFWDSIHNPHSQDVPGYTLWCYTPRVYCHVARAALYSNFFGSFVVESKLYVAMLLSNDHQHCKEAEEYGGMPQSSIAWQEITTTTLYFSLREEIIDLIETDFGGKLATSLIYDIDRCYLIGSTMVRQVVSYPSARFD